MAATASTTPQNYEQLGYGGPNLCQARGFAPAIISEAVSARTLLAKESGALCLFDRAAGTVFTLPAITSANIGMEFHFSVSVTCTSNAHKVITDAATTFIVGDINMVIDTSATTLAAAGNGTTHVAISSNGSTTGGVIGGRFRLKAINTTQWLIDGYISASGSLATPFATS